MTEVGPITRALKAEAKLVEIAEALEWRAERVQLGGTTFDVAQAMAYRNAASILREATE